MPIRRLPGKPSLEHLRNEAKALQRAHAASDSDAISRVREFHPRASEILDLKRADAQLVVARSYGFPSWPRLRSYIETVAHYVSSSDGDARGDESLEDRFLRLASLTYSADGPERRREAWDLLAVHPELAAATIHTAAAVGDVSAAAEFLARDRSLSRRRGGPRGWEPLLYLAYSRLNSPRAEHSTLEVARLLLEHGADPNIAAVQNVTPLMAAAGLGFWDAESPAPQNGTPESDTLEAVKICVEHGANVNETTKYGQLKVNGDPAELRYRYVFPAELPTDVPSYGDMRWDGATALHGAAVRGVNTVVKYLVEHGAKLDAKTTLGWTPLMIADHVFTANVERSWPETAAYLRDLMKERGLPTEDTAAIAGGVTAGEAR